jgi:hypothetical protein
LQIVSVRQADPQQGSFRFFSSEAPPKWPAKSGGKVGGMTINPQPRQVRRIVIRAFAELGVTIGTVSDLDEQILLDDGHIARSYKVGDYLAMWLVAVGILQFYDAKGNMIQTINLLEETKFAA